MRAVLGVIVGYATMFVFVMVTFTVMYLTLGADGAFKPSSYEPSNLWLVMGIALGVVAAVAGGFVCALIARASKPPMVLAALVLVLGLLLAIPVLTSEHKGPTVRGSDVGSFEAMNNARQPGWFAIVNPILAAAGIMLGGRLRGGDST